MLRVRPSASPSPSTKQGCLICNTRLASHQHHIKRSVKCNFSSGNSECLPLSFRFFFVSLIQQSVCSLQNILKLLGYWEITKVFFFCFCFLKICAKKALEKMNVLAPGYVAITHCIRLHNLTKVTHIWMKYPTYSESSFSEKIQSQRNSRSHRQRPVRP